MSGSDPGQPDDDIDPPELPQATISAGRRISLIWLIPFVAVLVAAWLGIRFVAQTGPLITISFLSADGLTAGQTAIRYKAVDLGTVEAIALSADYSHVVVRARMKRDARSALTDQARFWIVRPRLTPGSISGLETIVSGSYIELDPGAPGGQPRTDFTGLETPPAIRSDEPGRTYVLRGNRLGSVAIGSSLFYRDVNVGEVLGYDVGKPGDPVTVYAFVRAPYDAYVHENSYFWNASGISVSVGGSGFRVQLQSIQALLSGGIAFETPPEALRSPIAAANAEFPLFEDQATAESSHFKEKIRFLLHVKGSVAGLAVGAPVELYGIQVGIVSAIQLHVDPFTNQVEVRVHIDIEPERLPRNGPIPGPQKVIEGMSRLVESGLRAQLQSANFLTGQMQVALDFFPDAPPARLTLENNEYALPVQPGDLSNIQRNVADISAKLDRIPFDAIGQSLARILAGTDRIVNGADLRNALHDMAQTLQTARLLAAEANRDAGPALKRLPKISADLQDTVERASTLVGALNQGGGGNAALGRDLSRVLNQVSEAARSIRLLADYLDEHPGALIRGRTASAREK